MGRTGRKLKISDPSFRAELTKAISLGVPYLHACRLVGVSERSFYSWMREAEQIDQRAQGGARLTARDRTFLHFLHEIKRANATAIQNNLTVISVASRDSWQAAAWILERRFQREFSLRNGQGGAEPGPEQIGGDVFDEAQATCLAMLGTMRGIQPPPGMLPKAWTTFRWTVKQLSLLDSQARFIALPCGRGSGKTEIAFRNLVVRLAKRPQQESSPSLHAYTAPTNAQAMRVGWDKLQALIPRGWIRTVKVTDQYIETIFGSRVYVLGMDQPQRIEGNQWCHIILDESSDQHPGVFDKTVLPALTHHRGSCWRIGVPKRQGIGAAEYRRFCETAASEPNEDRACFSWPSSDVLSRDDLAYAMEHLDPRDFDEQFNATWQRSGGQVFFAFDEAYNVRPVTYDRQRALVVGSDFNVDPMCWSFGHRYDGRMEWFDELFMRDTNTQAALDATWARYQDHAGGFEFYGDASGRARKTSASTTDYLLIANDMRFKRAGRTIHYPESNPAIEDRIAAMNALFLNAAGHRRQFIDPKCEHLIADLKNRHYRPGTREPNDVGDLGHMTDAASYAVHALFPIQLHREQISPAVTIVVNT